MKKLFLKFYDLRGHSFVLIIPSLMLTLSILLRRAGGPFWVFSDPCYYYLFSALHKIKGMSLDYYYHPGVPLQLLVYAVIKVFSINHSPEMIINKVLTNPDFYLNIVYGVLAAFFFITSVILAAYVFYKTHDKIAALLTQLPGLFLITMPSFQADTTVLPVGANVSPEPVLIGIVNLFNLSFLMLFFSKSSRQTARAVLLLAFCCGLGLSTRLIFFTLALSALMVVPRHMKRYFFITFILSFFLWMLPIIHKSPLIWHWASNIIIHKDYYGTGGTGVVNWQIFWYFFSRYILARYGFFFFLVLLTFAWSSKLLLKNPANRNALFLWAISFGVLLHLLMICKHFGPQYLVIAIGSFSSIFFLTYINFPYQTKRFKLLTKSFILILAFQCAIKAMTCCFNLTSLTGEAVNFHDTLYSKYPNCTFIAGESNANAIYLNKEIALLNANKVFGHKLSDEFSTLSTRAFYFNSNKFESDDNDSYGIWDSKKRVYADDILALSPCVVLLSGSDFNNTPYKTSIIAESNHANAYLLHSSTEKEANVLFSLAEEFLEKGSYPQAFELALKSKQLNYQPEEKVNYFLALAYSHLQRK